MDTTLQSLLSKLEGGKNITKKSENPNNLTKEEDEALRKILLFSPFTDRIPLRRWQGQSSSLLKLDVTEEGVAAFHWIYVKYDEPQNFQSLVSQSENKNEAIFFSRTNKKYYRVANDCLHWSYYATGPFQRIEGGVWLDMTDVKPNTEDISIFELTEGDIFAINNTTGLLKPVKVIKEGEEKKENEKEEEKKKRENKSIQEITDDKITGIQSKLLKIREEKLQKAPENKDNELFGKIQPLLDKVNQGTDFQAWKQSMMESNSTAIPTIKSNAILNIFEEITDLYDLKFENKRDHNNRDQIDYFPVDNRNDIKYNLGVTLFEITLYPKSLLTALELPPFVFCGNITHSSEGMLPGKFYSNGKDQALMLNCKEKNVLKIQRALHQNIFLQIFPVINKEIPEFKSTWEAFNPSDFHYDPYRKKIPKGQKGFLTFAATLNVESDASEVFFALVKDPNTVLLQKDFIIAKKGFLLKNALDALWPKSFTEKCWKRIEDHKDILEQALGTNYFEDSHFDEDKVEQEMNAFMEKH